MSISILHQFNRGENESVYVTLKEYKERLYLDLRLYYKPENGEEMVPTRKGLTIAYDQLKDLKSAITACEHDLLALSQKKPFK